MKHARITTKVRHDAPAGESVIEFMASGPFVQGGSQGGLISITLRPDGSVDVHVYRADPAVFVVTPTGRDGSGIRRSQATKPVSWHRSAVEVASERGISIGEAADILDAKPVKP